MENISSSCGEKKPAQFPTFTVPKGFILFHIPSTTTVTTCNLKNDCKCASVRKRQRIALKRLQRRLEDAAVRPDSVAADNVAADGSGRHVEQLLDHASLCGGGCSCQNGRVLSSCLSGSSLAGGLVVAITTGTAVSAPDLIQTLYVMKTSAPPPPFNLQSRA